MNYLKLATQLSKSLATLFQFTMVVERNFVEI